MLVYQRVSPMWLIKLLPCCCNKWSNICHTLKHHLSWLNLYVAWIPIWTAAKTSPILSTTSSGGHPHHPQMAHLQFARSRSARDPEWNGCGWQWYHQPARVSAVLKDPPSLWDSTMGYTDQVPLIWDWMGLYIGLHDVTSTNLGGIKRSFF